VEFHRRRDIFRGGVLAKTALLALRRRTIDCVVGVMSLKTARHRKSRKVPSNADKPRKGGEANSPPGVVKPPEEAIKQWVVEAHALLEPGQFDPVKAGRLKMEMDVMMLAIQRAKAAEEHANSAEKKEFFDWLEANLPELSDEGRPRWPESEKVMSQDKSLLEDFDQRLERNIAANAGKKHGASQKTYADLADESGADDYTVKQRVMRARRRQKALQETIQDILGIAALAKTYGNRAVPPEESKRNRKKLLEAFRRLLKIK
jgi:hypothetical protein